VFGLVDQWCDRTPQRSSRSESFSQLRDYSPTKDERWGVDGEAIPDIMSETKVHVSQKWEQSWNFGFLNLNLLNVIRLAKYVLNHVIKNEKTLLMEYSLVKVRFKPRQSKSGTQLTFCF
jgi:hypothetical protein